MAENAAHQAKCLQHEAEVGALASKVNATTPVTAANTAHGLLARAPYGASKWP